MEEALDKLMASYQKELQYKLKLATEQAIVNTLREILNEHIWNLEELKKTPPTLEDDRDE
jgi:hypothetical protein